VKGSIPRGVGLPTAYNLGALFQYVTGREAENAHRALNDVQATATILRHKVFWESRSDDVFRFLRESPLLLPSAGNEIPTPDPLPNDDDSHEDNESGQELSLDESLIRSFGRMKFKVRIISKSARYGIKIYVITDAKTSFVLCVIIYIGKTTYNIGGKGKEMKKTVQGQQKGQQELFLPCP